MPRPNRGRAIHAERNLAQRIAYERQRPDRRWSYDGLAKRMADAGCPIAGGALWKIENGDPPRKVTVDELVAFAKVFGEDDVNKLLEPVALIRSRRARELYDRIAHAWDVTIFDGVRELFDALVEYLELTHDEPEMSGLVHDLLFPEGAGPSSANGIASVTDERGNVLASDLPNLRDALGALVRAAVTDAGDVAEAEIRARGADV